MKKLTLLSVSAENYMGVEKKDIPIAKKNTYLTGVNRCGKTTMGNVTSEILTGKTMDGKVPTNLRPHDMYGNDIDRIPIIRSINCVLNGKSTEIEKITEQKWKKPRGEETEYFAGNETRFKVNGFDKKPKDYEAFIAEELADADTLLMCSNAQPFLNVLQKSTTEGRKILANLAGFSDEMFIESHPEYKHIPDITKGNSVEDTIKQLKRNLTAQRKEVERKRTELSYEKTRDTGESDKVMILEEEYQIILQRQAEVEEKLKGFDNSTADELTAKLAQIRSEMAAYQAEETADYYKEIKSLEKSLSDLKTKDNDLSTTVQNLGFEIETISLKRENTRKTVLSLHRQYEDVSAGLLINGKCPVCGSEIKEETEELKERNKDIRTRLSAIQKQIDDYEEYLQKSAKEFERLTAEQNKLRDERTDVREQIYMTENMLLAVEKPDVTQDTIYKQLEAKAADAEMKLARQAEIAEQRKLLENNRLELVAKAAQNRAMLQNEKDLAEAKEGKVTDLEDALKAEVQKCAMIEKAIDKVLDYSIAKNKALADMINPHFTHFKFEFLEYTQEGTPVETCKLVCNGTSYFGGLNGGDKKLVEIYLVAGLQELNGLCLPIWVDEASLIDPYRIPNNLEQQLIIINRTDDTDIVVKGEN